MTLILKEDQTYATKISGTTSQFLLFSFAFYHVSNFHMNLFYFIFLGLSIEKTAWNSAAICSVPNQPRYIVQLDLPNMQRQKNVWKEKINIRNS